MEDRIKNSQSLFTEQSKKTTMEDQIKGLQSQMAEQLIQTQKLEGQFSQMLMMMQKIQELLKKSPNSPPNSELNSNSENFQHQSLGKMSSLDDGVEESPKSVSLSDFEDDKQEPISFTALPVFCNVSEIVQGPEKKIYVCGTTNDELHKLYEHVQVWKFVEEPGVDRVKPRVSCEEFSRTMLIALNFVRILKWKLGLHGKFVWYRLSKILDVLEEKPPPDDLVVHNHLLEEAVEHEEGDGTGVVESIEGLWEIVWRFDRFFVGFEHLPKSSDVMASMLVDVGVLRNSELWLSVTETRVTTLDQNLVSATDLSSDKILYEFEQESLEVYRRIVDQANRSTAQLR